MQKRFYVDTAIRRDYFEDRKDSIRPLGEFAFQFLKCCGAEGCLVLYSEFVVYELRKDYSEEEINLVFSSFMDFLVESPYFARTAFRGWAVGWTENGLPQN